MYNSSVLYKAKSNLNFYANDALNQYVQPCLHRLTTVVKAMFALICKEFAHCINCKHYDSGSLNKNILRFTASYGYANIISSLHSKTRSLLKKLNSNTDLLHSLTSPLDVICIFETKLNHDLNLGRIQIDRYSFISTHSKTSFSDTGIYISDRIQFDRRTYLECDMDDCEASL